MPGGETWIELVKFHSPTDDKDSLQYSANALGIRHICFKVEDINYIIAKMKKKGNNTFREIQQYEESYKLLCSRS